MQTVALLTSELVANAVRHAGADAVGLCVDVSDSHVRVEVADDGGGFEPQLLPPDPSRGHGWGLYLVDELASRWGVIGGAGSRVWFEVDR